MGGIAAARGQYIVMGDADARYNFSNSRFFERLRAGNQLVIGNCFKGGVQPRGHALAAQVCW